MPGDGYGIICRLIGHDTKVSDNEYTIDDSLNRQMNLNRQISESRDERVSSSVGLMVDNDCLRSTARKKSFENRNATSQISNRLLLNIT